MAAYGENLMATDNSRQSRFGTTVEPAYGAMDATGGPPAQA
jgi:hypothetical protein